MFIDAVHAIETVFGIWLGMSAIAFILIFVALKQKSAAVDVMEKRDALVLDLAKKERKTASTAAPARKAA